eukprot:262543-Chlamydomonas_euryale.AAC.6
MFGPHRRTAAPRAQPPHVVSDAGGAVARMPFGSFKGSAPHAPEAACVSPPAQRPAESDGLEP